MNQAELEKRQERAVRETFVVAKTDEGFRIHAPTSPARVYLVGGGLEAPTCSCPDFENHQSDPDWRCKHILAVLGRLAKPDPQEPRGIDSGGEDHERILHEEKRSRSDGAIENGAESGTSQMALKRSVSPDGRIDSLSVELSFAVDGASEEVVKARARRALGLQSEIVRGFLKRDSDQRREPQEVHQPRDGAVAARLLDVAGMNTRYGRRLFVNVRVNGEVLKLFGSRKQLADAVARAGFPDLEDEIHEGAQLNVPCRVTTKRSDDGRYVNVDEVLPAGPEGRGNGARP